MLDEESQRSIDLEIAADSGGKEVARLWCECKVKAREGIKQLDDQFVALKKAKPRRSRLVAVVRTHADRKKIEARKDGRPDGFKVAIITWSEVAALVARRGGELAKSGWQEKATAPRAPAVQRVLAELFWYLDDHVKAVPEDPKLLMQEVATNLLDYRAVRPPKRMRGAPDRIELALDGLRPSWIQARMRYLELDVDAAGTRVEIGAAVRLQRKYERAAWGEDAAWRSRVERKGFELDREDSTGFIYTSAVLADLVDQRMPLPDQATALARSAEGYLRDIDALKSGPERHATL
jgi:hypothetical protein